MTQKNDGTFDRYFDTIFKDSNELTEKEFDRAADIFEREIGRFMPDSRDTRILDIGCGCGHFLYYLKRKEYSDFRGIDVSPQQVDFCKKHVTGNVESAEAGEFLKDKDGKYDVVSMYAVLEHVPKDEVVGLLKAVYRSLGKAECS